MTLEVKICGITSAAALAAAAEGGAALVGFVFYPKSPRHLTHEAAAALARAVPGHILRVGLVVDQSDDAIGALLGAVSLDMLQLHGSESPERAAAIRARFGKPVMKAIAVAEAADLAAADRYVAVADRLLFDGKPPASMPNALPGGNALPFDWRLLKGRDWPKPWMLAGGLTAENLAEAVTLSGARRVDVSSGVEDRPGQKSPAKIKALLDLARTL
ncbi:MAG: phosphoribosylanthranilate isomerase [Pseudomonadota bacterium]